MIEEGQKTVQWTAFPTRDVVRPEFRDQDLPDMGAEAFAVDRPVDDPGRDDPVMAQGTDESHGVPVPERRAADQSLAPRRPAAQRGHVGLGPRLVDEDEMPWIKSPLILLPLRAPPCDLGAQLFGGKNAFF